MILSAQEHLNKAGFGYLDMINGSDDESFKRTRARFEPLTFYSNNPQRILSVGIGGGKEVETLKAIFPNTHVYGIDLSNFAIKMYINNIRNNLSKTHLVNGDARFLPFPDNQFDIITLSSVLHEIFSYSSDGIFAWKKGIQEAVRALSLNGALLFRDCKAPETNQEVTVLCKTELSKQFYEYFRKEFRVFNMWSDMFRQNVKYKRQINEDDYPALTEQNTTTLPFFKVAELLLHFRHFWHSVSRNLTQLGDSNWKEISESYFPLHPSNPSSPMNMNEYINVFKDIAKKVLQEGDELVCAQLGESQRPITHNF